MEVLAYISNSSLSEKARSELSDLEKELGVKIEWMVLKEGEKGYYHFPVFEFSNNDYSAKFFGYKYRKTVVDWIKKCIEDSKVTS